MPKLALPQAASADDYVHPILGGGLGGGLSFIAASDTGGLTQFGALIETLAPGARSSFRHWHEAEDEMIYMLDGEVTLIEDGLHLLRPGDVVCWPAGMPLAHCLENRSAAPARYLLIGSRRDQDRVHYPDHDLVTTKDGAHRHYAHADGRPYLAKAP